ncbi:MAG: hypothetical protein QNJ47_22005 [Nostocaceae cyanobacterium]|nr:hypothetical protein [Nostocaceae cyanobacterium]
MTKKQFESQYRQAMSETLDELQTAMLMLAQLQRKISEIGSSVQNLSESVEDFLIQEKAD